MKILVIKIIFDIKLCQSKFDLNKFKLFLIRLIIE